MNVCDCMGPGYSEPYCICKMERLGLPLNETARAAEYAKCGEELKALFGPGGMFYKEEKTK